MSRAPGRLVVLPAFVACVAMGACAPGAIANWGLFPTLGLFPGVALASLLPLERGAFPRWVLGVAASPFVACVLALALMRAGLPLPLAARVVAITATLAWLATEIRRATQPPSAADRRPGLRFAWCWALGAAALIGVVLFTNPFLRMRADAWIHGGIVCEILARGIPPLEPRFAGLTLNYVWFYNFFIALLVALRGGDLFAFMGIANVASMFATMGLTWLIARQVWRSSRAAAGAAVLMGLAFNAAVWMLWPVRLLSMLGGHLTGMARFRDLTAHMHWNDAEVIYDLSAWKGFMVNFLDKPLHGTALNMAYVFLLTYLWAMVRALRGQRGPALAWGAISAAGMFFFHGVVALSAIPAALAALGVAWLLAGRLRWLPGRGRTVAFALASVAGALTAAPYTLAIARAWPAAKSGLHHSYVSVDPEQLITLVTALAVGAWFARGAIRRAFAERRAAAAVVVLYAASMLVYACLVTLPDGSHAKFVFQVFIGLAVLGGAMFHAEWAAWRRRFGLAGACGLALLVLGSTPLITLRGYLLDRTGERAPELHPAPGEGALYAWMAASTPIRAVFVDFDYRSLIMVTARRQLLLGSTKGPEQAAFPLAQILRRRAVMTDLYGRADSLGQDVALLRSLDQPAYVLVRAADAARCGRPARHFDARADLFERVYDRDGFTVYHVTTGGPAAAPQGAPRP